MDDVALYTFTTEIAADPPPHFRSAELSRGRDLMEHQAVPAHSTNQRAFRDGDMNEPFFRLYTLLVAIEIALKDRLPQFTHGHDLSTLVP